MKKESLLALLKKKRSFFEALLDLTEQELHSTLSNWSDLIKKKQILLLCIEELDERLKPFAEHAHELSHEIIEELEQTHLVITQIMHLSHYALQEKKKHMQ